MSWFTGASDALEQALVDQEAKRRQAMLDAIAADERTERNEDRRTNREIQRLNAEALKEQRAAAADKAKQDRALGTAKVLKPGAEIDEQTAAMLGEGGLRSLVDEQAAREMQIPGNPLSPGAALPPVQVPGKRVYRGTADQLQKQEDQKRRAEYIASLPAESPVRQLLEAQAATGDNSLPTGLFQPKEPKIIGGSRTGYFKLNPDGTKTQVIAPVPDKPTKPERDRIQLVKNPDGSSEIVNLDKGTRTVLRQGETPAQAEARMEREAAARARGTAAGKKATEAPGFDYSSIPLLGRLFSQQQPAATPAPAAAPTGAVEYDWVPGKGLVPRKQ